MIEIKERPPENVIREEISVLKTKLGVIEKRQTECVGDPDQVDSFMDYERQIVSVRRRIIFLEGELPR